MTNTQTRTWISPKAYERLQRELDTLRELFATAGADGENDESTAAVLRAWQVRIQRIHDLLLNAVIGEDPADDGIAEPGMVVTIRYNDTARPLSSGTAARWTSSPATASWPCSARRLL